MKMHKAIVRMRVEQFERENVNILSETSFEKRV